MLKGLARSVLMGAVQRGNAAPLAGPISTALLTTGASLVLSRGRRPVGLAMLAAGGLLRWREMERARATDVPVSAPPAPASGASRARARR